MNADELIETLRGDVEKLLQEVGEHISRTSESVACKVGRHQNENFPLRAYLSIDREGGARELAITVDVKSDGDRWQLSSDVCYEDGVVLFVGPVAEVVSDTADASQRRLAEWAGQLRRFLAENRDAVAKAARSL